MYANRSSHSLSEPSASPNRSSGEDRVRRIAPAVSRAQSGENDRAHTHSIVRSRSLQHGLQAVDKTRRSINTVPDAGRFSRHKNDSPRSVVPPQSPAPSQESRQVLEKARQTINTVVDHGRSSRHQIDSPRSAVSPKSPTPFYSSSRGGKELRASVVQKDLNDVSPSSSPSSYRRRILFYHKHERYYGFTNFSPHPVHYNEKTYPTSEHLFQSFKFSHRPNLAEHIRTCDPRPSKAFSEARRFQAEVRPDWKRVNIQLMDIALWNKFNQHYDLKEELLGTGNAELVENSDKDAFWGIGSDGKGRNELGRALERLRTQLRT